MNDILNVFSNKLNDLTGKKIVKIGRHLANIWIKCNSLLFFGPPCMRTVSNGLDVTELKYIC